LISSDSLEGLLSVVQKVLKVVHVSVCCLSDENPKIWQNSIKNLRIFWRKSGFPAILCKIPKFRQNFMKIAAKNDRFQTKFSNILQNLEIHQKNSKKRKNLQNFSVERCEGVQDLVDLEKC